MEDAGLRAHRQLHGTVTLEAIEQDHDKGVSGVLSQEQLLKFSAILPDDLQRELTNQKSHVIIVADASGSMAGSAWNQVVSSLLYIREQSESSQSVTLDVITYGQDAQRRHAPWPRNANPKADGRSTNFVAAFRKIIEVMKSYPTGNLSRTVILFMSDGHENNNTKEKLNREKQAWQKELQGTGHQVTVHAVGFSRQHDFELLNGLTDCGTDDGMFRYCEPQDGTDALLNKLNQLFDFVNCSCGEIQIQLSLGREDQFLTSTGSSSSLSVGGEIRVGGAQGVCSVETECWVLLKDVDNLPDINVTVTQGDHTQQINCQVSRKMVTGDFEKVDWSLKVMSRNTDTLTAELSDAVQNKGDISRLEKSVRRMQKRVSEIQVFGKKGWTKELRSSVLESIGEVQAKLDSLHGLLASYSRGEGKSIAMLARITDLRYDAKFSRSRRQRLMDIRVSENARKATKAQEKMNSLIVDKDEMENLSSETLDFYFCVLSQCNVREILLDPTDESNIMGFGLAVKRPEFVLDNPLGIQIHEIGGTLVSRSAMMDAIEHRISVEGHLSTHGGFSFSDDAPLGVATVGMSREPINAWLPLYVCKSHWDRVKILLKPSLGYLCTLDPLGFAFKQLDVIFLVLGRMIGCLNPTNRGSHRLQLIFALQRTCAAAVEEFNLESSILEMLTNFLAGPQGRTKDVVPDLLLLIGYLVSLPAKTAAELFKSQGVAGMSLRQFWLAWLAEWLRRAAGSRHKETNSSAILLLIDDILHNNSNGPPEPSSETGASASPLARLMLALHAARKPGYQSATEVPECEAPLSSRATLVTELARTSSASLDRSMEIWAQAHLGVIRNKNQAEKVSQAKKEVKNWQKEGRDELLRTVTDGATGEIGKTEFDAQMLTSTMINAMARELLQLHRHALTSAIPGCIAFLHAWLSCRQDVSEMDSNSGMAPDTWIERVKMEIDDTYARLNDVNKVCNVETTVEDVPMATVSPSANSTEAGSKVNLEPVTGEEDNDDNDDGDDDDDVDNDDVDDNDVYIIDDDDGPNNRQNEEQNKFQVYLPQLLYLLLGDAEDGDLEAEIVLLCRAMLCHSLYYHSNSKARSAAEEGKMVDLKHGRSAALQVLQNFHDELEEKEAGAIEGMIECRLWQRANFCMVISATPWAFVGYLLNTHTERLAGFKDLVTQLLSPDLSCPPPCLREKMEILLTGKYLDHAVLASGNTWIPERTLVNAIKRALGEEAWDELDLMLRSNVEIHVYRETDFPNRHGHCNSNPYIPNSLRRKLAMPLLLEKNGKERRD